MPIISLWSGIYWNIIWTCWVFSLLHKSWICSVKPLISWFCIVLSACCESERIYIWLKSIKSLICFKWLMIFRVWCIANSSAYKIKHWDFNFQLKFIEFLSIYFVFCDSILKSFNICQKVFQSFIKVVKLTAAAIEILFFALSVYNIIWF